MSTFCDLSNGEGHIMYCQRCLNEALQYPYENFQAGSSNTPAGDCTDAGILDKLKKHFSKSKKVRKADASNEDSGALVFCSSCQESCAQSGNDVAVATMFNEDYTSSGIVPRQHAVPESSVCSPMLYYSIHPVGEIGGIGGLATSSLNGHADAVHCIRWGRGVDEYHASSSIWRRARYVKNCGVMCRGLAFIGGDQFCLFVSDQNNDRVHRIELIETGRDVVINWPVGRRPEGLSVTQAGNLLVTCNGDRQLQEYTPYGHKRDKITLQSSIESPWHAVELPGSSTDRRFVVSYSSQVGSSDGVCIVDKRGGILCQYAGNRFPVGQLRDPRNLAVDSNGYVLVADSGNHRVLAMDPTLSRAKVLPLPVKDGVVDPLALCLDESTSRLYVGEWSRRRVLVFNNVCNIGALLRD